MKRFLRRCAASHSENEQEGSKQAKSQGSTPPLQHPLAPERDNSRQGKEQATIVAQGRSTQTPAPTRTLPSAALQGVEMPSVLFNNFDRRYVDLGELAHRGLVLYVYPGCAHTPSDGARGLAADALQHRTYTRLRDHFADVVPHGALVALSSISPTEQFHRSPTLALDQDEGALYAHYLLSDEMLQLAQELGLPTFEHEGKAHYERLTLIARSGRIQRVFHPVLPGQDARQALTWLQLH